MVGFTTTLSRGPRFRPLYANISGNFPSNEVELTDVNGYSYLIDIQVGGQTFTVTLDTGSSDLWIVSSGCTDADCQGVAKYHNTPTLSLSLAPFNLTYLSGSVTGTIGTETVSFGQFEVSCQAFALANKTVSLGLSVTGNSGILGLSFPSDASIPRTTGRTLLENVFVALDEPHRFFAYQLGRDKFGGTFSIGEIDVAVSSRVSEFFYSPVYITDGADYDYWKLPLLSLVLNGTVAPFTLSPSKIPGSISPIAVLDTGTTLILGPTQDVDNFWTVAGGARKGSDGQWQVKCEHAVALGLTLGNDRIHKEFVLDPSDITWAVGASEGTADGWCLGGVQANDGVFSGDWLFGDVFLRNVYVTHHVATSSTPPLIGLLGVTNASTALRQFRAVRGEDTVPPTQIHMGSFTSHSSPLSIATIFTLALALGFLGSMVLPISQWCYREARQRRVTKGSDQSSVHDFIICYRESETNVAS